MTGLTITRPIRQADLAAVLALSHLVPEAPWWSEAHLQQLTAAAPALDQPLTRRAWISESAESQVSGFIALQALRIPAEANLLECEIEAIVVHPHHRRAGVGRLLLDSALAWCRSVGASIVRLEVRSSNTPAINLYAQCGFLSTGARPGYYESPTEDAVLMELRM